MSKQKQYMFLLVGWILLCLMISGIYDVKAAEADITLKITGLGVRHGTPENLPIGMVMALPTDQEISGQFTENFRVEDLLGSIVGHYTTIQCDGIYGPYGTKLTGIELKAGNILPQLLMGMTGPNVYINPDLSHYINITEPVTYFYKETETNQLGIINKYGDKPWIKILIPSSAPPGIYSGTIVFSFYPY